MNKIFRAVLVIGFCLFGTNVYGQVPPDNVIEEWANAASENAGRNMLSRGTDASPGDVVGIGAGTSTRDINNSCTTNSNNTPEECQIKDSEAEKTYIESGSRKDSFVALNPMAGTVDIAKAPIREDMDKETSSGPGGIREVTKHLTDHNIAGGLGIDAMKVGLMLLAGYMSDNNLRQQAESLNNRDTVLRTYNSCLYEKRTGKPLNSTGGGGTQKSWFEALNHCIGGGRAGDGGVPAFSNDPSGNMMEAKNHPAHHSHNSTGAGSDVDSASADNTLTLWGLLLYENIGAIQKYNPRGGSGGGTNDASTIEGIRDGLIEMYGNNHYKYEGHSNAEGVMEFDLKRVQPSSNSMGSSIKKGGSYFYRKWLKLAYGDIGKLMYNKCVWANETGNSAGGSGPAAGDPMETAKDSKAGDFWADEEKVYGVGGGGGPGLPPAAWIPGGGNTYVDRSETYVSNKYYESLEPAIGDAFFQIFVDGESKNSKLDCSKLRLWDDTCNWSIHSIMKDLQAGDQTTYAELERKLGKAVRTFYFFAQRIAEGRLLAMHEKAFDILLESSFFTHQGIKDDTKQLVLAESGWDSVEELEQLLEKETQLFHQWREAIKTRRANEIGSTMSLARAIKDSQKSTNMDAMGH